MYAVVSVSPFWSELVCMQWNTKFLKDVYKGEIICKCKSFHVDYKIFCRRHKGINMHRIPDNQIGMQTCNNIDYITYIL